MMVSATTRKRLLWAGLPLVLSLVLVGFLVLPAFAQGGALSGHVVSPDGYPLPAGTLVRLYDPGETIVHGQAIPDLDDGAFSLGPVPNGLYILKAIPPAGSGLSQSLPRPVSVVDAPVSGINLHLTRPQIQAAVTAPDGVTPAEGRVSVYAGDGHTLQVVPAPGGQALIGGLPPGGYWLQASPTSDDPYWKSARLNVTVPDLTSTQVVTLSLTAADLWGYVKDGNGVPIPHATVVAASGTGDHQADATRASGYWAIGGLPAGAYTLTAFPPLKNSGLLRSDPVPVSLPGASNPYTLVLNNPPKVVQGQVTTNTGHPVAGAQVLAWRVNQHGRVEALSGADGRYRLDLAPGLWALTVRSITGTVPADWVFPLPPQLVYFKHNNQPETHTQDFQVPTADAAVLGTVTLPGGGTPPFPVKIGLHNDEGVGRSAMIDPADGSFQLSVPHGGYKVAVQPESPEYLGPPLDPIQVPPNGTFDMGTLTLVPVDAMITGTLTTQDGAGVAGIPVVAWRHGAPGVQRTLSGPDGIYALPVSGETWHVQPAPGPGDPYLYTGSGQEVDVPPGGLVPDIDFTLLATDATIQGVLVDEAGEPVSDADGWAAAFQVGNPSLHNGAPIVHGTFTIFVPAGTYNVAAHLPAGSPYLSTGERRVTVASGEVASLTLTVRAKDAAIAGALWDPRNQDVVSGVKGGVGAWSEGSWAATPINAGNGAYRLGVAAGLWHLNYRIDPHSGYAKIGGPVHVPVQSGKTSVVPLPILPKDSALIGQVLDPDGAPLPGALVVARGVGGDVHHLVLAARTNEQGDFRLAVPNGRYRLGAAGGAPGWIKPVEVIVRVPPGGVSGPHILQFLRPDAQIQGTLTVLNTQAEGRVYVWAWSDDGGFTHGRFPVTQAGGQASGPYQLDVTSGTVWHLGAVFETSQAYWAGRGSVAVNAPQVTLDLTLNGPHPRPGPVVVTFDAADPQRIHLADGTHIFIPPGALPVEGLVTLRIVPIATLPHQHHARLVEYGYAFLATDEQGAPIEDHFNQDVVISFAYDGAVLAQKGILEAWLKPAYFSTTTDSWTFPESYVIDADADRVVMQIDHFTDFALMGNPGAQLFLPVIRR